MCGYHCHDVRHRAEDTCIKLKIKMKTIHIIYKEFEEEDKKVPSYFYIACDDYSVRESYTDPFYWGNLYRDIEYSLYDFKAEEGDAIHFYGEINKPLKRKENTFNKNTPEDDANTEKYDRLIQSITYHPLEEYPDKRIVKRITEKIAYRKTKNMYEYVDTFRGSRRLYEEQILNN